MDRDARDRVHELADVRALFLHRGGTVARVAFSNRALEAYLRLQEPEAHLSVAFGAVAVRAEVEEPVFGAVVVGGRERVDEVVLVGRDRVGTPKPGTFGRIVGVL